MTLPLVIGFSGKIGSGKTTLSRAFAFAHGALWASFGDFVRAQARALQLDYQSGRVLQDLGQSLIDSRGSGWLVQQVIHPWIAKNRDKPFAIDGVRHLSVFSEIKSQADPARAKLVFIDGSARGSDSSDDGRNSEHQTERDVVSGLRDAADFIVPSSMRLDDALALLSQAYKSWQHGA